MMDGNNYSFTDNPYHSFPAGEAFELDGLYAEHFRRDGVPFTQTRDSTTTTRQPTIRFTPTWPQASFHPQAVSRMSSVMPGTDAALDLGSYRPDNATIESLDINSLTTDVHASPWIGFVGQPREAAFWPSSEMMIDQTDYTDANHDTAAIEELFSNEDASLSRDSAFQSLTHFPPNTQHVNPGNLKRLTFSPEVEARPSATMRRTASMHTVSSVRSRRSSNGGTRRRSSAAPLPPCAICGKVPKNKSDATKHGKQHTRPYKCKVKTCNKSKEGFGTPNDLDRHEICKHNKGGKGFVCWACPVAASGPKWWPRLDNYKAHIRRKHKDWDEVELIKVSRKMVRPDDAISEHASVFSGGNSNYYTASQADLDAVYQDDYTIPPSAAAMLSRNPSQQGEAIDWLNSSNTMDELAGLGVTHQADRTFLSGREHDASSHGSGRRADNGHRLSISSPTIEQLPAILHSHRTNIDAGGHSNVHSLSISPCTTPLARRRISDDIDDEFETKSVIRYQSPVSFLQTSCVDEKDSDLIPCPYEGCKKTKNRPCDLRKHLKRHTRPYGCTYPQCYERHGSRSDWIRHEKVQHSLPVSWLCDISVGNKPCRAWFRQISQLHIHLASDHNSLPEQDVSFERVDGMRLGKEGRDRFWCGFCAAVISSPITGERDPFAVRCEHVGNHFDKEGRVIGQWVCVEAQKRKDGISLKERREARKSANLSLLLAREEDGRVVHGDGDCAVTVPSSLASSAPDVKRSSQHDPVTGETYRDRVNSGNGYPIALVNFDECGAALGGLSLTGVLERQLIDDKGLPRMTTNFTT